MDKKLTDMAAAILAGGENRRFGGQNKANAFISGEKIIARIINVIKTVFEEIVIVTNSPDDYAGYDEYIITGDHYLKKGPLGGIHAALKRTTREAVFVFAGDMPFIDKDLVLEEIEYFDRMNQDIVVPVVKGMREPLHSIYKKSVTGKLEQYLTENRWPAVIDFLKTVETHYFEIEESERIKRAFANINSPSDIGLFNNFRG
jgi:molybdopterin-guanine dinucleotide biosynthesis protein A